MDGTWIGLAPDLSALEDPWVQPLASLLEKISRLRPGWDFSLREWESWCQSNNPGGGLEDHSSIIREHHEGRVLGEASVKVPSSDIPRESWDRAPASDLRGLLLIRADSGQGSSRRTQVKDPCLFDGLPSQSNHDPSEPGAAVVPRERDA